METGDRKKSGNSEQDARSRRQIQVFLVCLVIATFIWFMIKLSKEYTYESLIRIEYRNFPPGKSLTRVPDSTLILSVKASGYYTLYRKFFKNTKTIYIDLSNLKVRKSGSFYEGQFQTSDLSSDIQSQLSKNERLASIFPTTLVFRFENAISKKVPVKVDLDLGFEKQFDLYDPVRIIPDSVLVTGPAGQVDTLHFVVCEKIKIDGLKENTILKVRLAPQTSFTNLIYKPDSVSLDLKVEEFTESSLEIPITIDSLPGGIRIKTYPEKVTIRIHVANKDFASITPEMFVLAVDAKNALTEKGGKLKVEVRLVPPHVKVVQIEPEKLEYIITK